MVHIVTLVEPSRPALKSFRRCTARRTGARRRTPPASGRPGDVDDPGLDDFVPVTPATVTYSQALPPETLYRGLADNSVGKVIEYLLRNDLVLVDELGFAPLNDTGAQLLFRFNRGRLRAPLARHRIALAV